MAAAAPGTETLTANGPTGDLAVTVYHNPDGTWSDPAVTAAGTGTGLLHLWMSWAGGVRSGAAVQIIPGADVAAATLAALGIAAYIDVQSMTLSPDGP